MPPEGGKLKRSIVVPKENRLAQRRRGAEDMIPMRNDDLGTNLLSGAKTMKGELGYLLNCKEALFNRASSLASTDIQIPTSAPQRLCGRIIR